MSNFQRPIPTSPNPSHERTNSMTSHKHSVSSHTSSRKPSIVEMLSSPPPLPNNNHSNDDINPFTLSRANSISSNKSIELQDVQLNELIETNKLVSINSSYSIKSAFEILQSHNLTSVPVSITKDDSSNLLNCLTFDYSDLNTYILMIMNKINIKDLNVDDQDLIDVFDEYVEKGKKGEAVPVDFIIRLHPKNPFIKINEDDHLVTVMEILGNGVHRVALTDNSGKIVGVLSQRRLVKFIWENARRFSNLEYYFNQSIEDLKIGSANPLTIYGDNLLIDALHKMFVERISSLAVIDRKGNLLANISIVDVKNLTSSKNSHLLYKTVMNFISFNLSQKGIDEGKDQFPIFHINKFTGLGRVLAKLVATESHRLWIVETSHNNSTIEDTLSNESGPGKLVGVITLTDILGFLASTRSSGKKIDPQFARNQRRRSSTSTTRLSFDNLSNLDIFRK